MAGWLTKLQKAQLIQRRPEIMTPERIEAAINGGLELEEIEREREAVSRKEAE